ncbi:diguanylate cyclase [Enterovibrio sp. ZSDZ35]|uniref:diguanylate cyclase n=1 Tax=Enterovibrio qingdaonensis TaxID=2899818 RepID=A0ABT5QRY5_9GAMM|nr:diguanylate cyclase [Enterovibrio sp. ZSDZ35]MDD1783740.1 diguanylate cyclase [Enterovibrio sp. ZSDZ35]
MPITALIADDDKATAKLVEVLLNKWGVEAIVAHDGVQALEVMMQETPPTLLLFDWEMPGYSGIELCQKIREIDTDDPPYIIICTARDSAEHIAEGLNKGANDFVSKPFNTQVLRARVEVGKRTLELQSRLINAMSRLDKLARFDELTGLMNRRAVFECIHEDFSRAARSKSCLCFTVCDIDWFKQVNDNFGHPAGDAILSELGALLTHQLRPYDRLGRVGGEEFLLLFSVEDKDNAVRVLERIRQAIECHPFKHENTDIKVTMSFGATVIDMVDNALRVEDYFKRADDALYTSKANGRNCITFL